jgi:hypothetical protein
MLGISRGTLRNWRLSGRLQPAQMSGTQALYTPAQIEYARRQQSGTLAARAFALFEAGHTAVAVVIELEADPEAVRTWHAHYIDLSSSWIVRGPDGSRDRWESAYKIGALTPDKLRRALELCAADPKLRALLLGETSEDKRTPAEA